MINLRAAEFTNWGRSSEFQIFPLSDKHSLPEQGAHGATRFFCYGRAYFRSERQEIRFPYTRFPLPLYRKMAVAMPLNASATCSTSIKRFMPPKLWRTALGGMTICVSYSLKLASELVCDIQTEIAARAVAACYLLHMTLTAVGKGYVAELLEHHLLTYDVLQTKFELEMAQGARE